MAQTVTTQTKSDAPVGQIAGIWETALYMLARYREASIAAVAILLVAYIQSRSSILLHTQEMSVVLRDTGRHRHDCRYDRPGDDYR